MDSRASASESHPRSLSRQVAFQFLYQDELNPPADAASDEELSRVDVWRVRRFAAEAFRALSADHAEDAPEGPEHDLPVAQWLASPAHAEFTRSLIAGVRRYRAQLDARIAQAAENWSVGRMAATDRVIIRLGTYEIVYGDTPDPVAIDEAIELAKRFGSAQSAAFVNGILDRLMHEKQ